MMIDLVQPYLHWNDQIDNDPKYLQRFWDRIMKDANERGTGTSEHPFVGTEHIEVGWEIGGALTVDDTALFYGYIGGDEPVGGTTPFLARILVVSRKTRWIWGF